MKISVVVPMYNSASTIQGVIESVLNQTYSEPMEIIVVNDGSSDGCEKIVEAIILNNQSIHTVELINKENGGVSSARNRGIKEAAGDWIALLDADDIWFPEKLEKQFEVIAENPDISFIGCNRNGEVYPFFGKKKKALYSLNAKEIIIKWYPQTSTAVVKRDLLVKAGLYDERRSHAEDGDLWLRLAVFGDLWVLNEDLVLTGGGKRSFGVSGLSANMQKMYRGEVLNVRSAFNRNQIGFLFFCMMRLYMNLKYIRRKFIVWGTK